MLVVDDNRDAVESLSLLLKLAGQTVAHAHDGREALAQFAAFDPDVVVLDIGLPVLNGYEVARQMRATATRKVVLVALTGWGQDEDRRRTTDAGFDHHLVKPVEFESLKTLLASLGTPRLCLKPQLARRLIDVRAVDNRALKTQPNRAGECFQCSPAGLNPIHTA